MDWILFIFGSVYIAINKAQEMKSINSVQNCASFFTEGSLVIETLEPLIVSFHILNFGKAINRKGKSQPELFKTIGVCLWYAIQTFPSAVSILKERIVCSI